MEFEIPKTKREVRDLEAVYHTHNGIDSPKTMNPMFNLSKKSVQKGVTANTGSTQATGEQIIKDIVEIATCANAGDSLTLPFAVIGLQILIINHGANSADIFPNVGDAINEAAVDTAKALPADNSLLCSCWNDGQWECLLLART